MIETNKNRDLLLNLLWGACSIEAILSIVYLLILPTNTKNAILAGFSSARLALAACLILGFIISFWLLLSRWLFPTAKGVVSSIARLQLAEGAVFFTAVMISIICIFLMVLPPPFLRGALIQRFAPLLVWVIVCGFQIASVIFIRSKQQIITTADRLTQFLGEIKSDYRFGIFLLLLSLVFGMLSLAFTYYNVNDEFDTAYNGWLLSKGTVLYRDIFSDHFPLSYIWTSLISSIFGSSIQNYRLSLLLLRIVLFGVAMIISRDRFVIGSVSLSWSIIGPLYLGNMLLFYSIESIFMVSAFFIIFALLSEEVKYSRKFAIWIGVLIGLALLTDPLMYLPGAIIFIFLVKKGFNAGQTNKEKILNAIVPFLSTGILLLIYGGYLVATSSLNEFIQDSILFSIQIATRYPPYVTPSITPFVRSILTGFNVLSPAYRQIIDPYYDWYGLGFLGAWALATLLPRLAVIGFTIILLLRKKYSKAILLYLVACAFYARGPGYYFQSAFIITSLTAASFVLIDLFSVFLSIWKYKRSEKILIIIKQLATISIAVIISVMFIWFNLRLANFWIQKRTDFSFEKQFNQSMKEAAHYRTFACGNTDATFLYYPYNPVIGYFTKMPPATRYYHMGPMIAEVGLQEVLDTLGGKFAIVYVDKNSDLWHSSTNNTLSILLEYLDDYYLEVEKNVYLSPKLQEYCHLVQK